MTSFESFCEEVLTEIKKALPPSYGEGECLLREVQKLNESYRGLIIRRKDQSITAAVKMERYYQEYRNGKEMKEILDEIMKQTGFQLPEDLCYIPDAMKSYNTVQSRLFLRISNQERNQAILSMIPHRNILDLALTYHIDLKEMQGLQASIMINQELLENWGISEEQLHQDAINNSPKIMPCEILPIQKVLKDAGGPRDLVKEPAMPLYVVRSRGWGSAAALFYPGVMQRLSDMAKGNYYILPSSIHEVLMLPAKELTDITSLKMMVKEINMTVVEENNRLSNHVYLYDKEKKKLCITE